MQSNKPEWYVIQVISWTEENVKQSLFQRRESLWVEDFILDVFVPTSESITTRANWKQVVKQKNILPWYILVQMIVTNESWYIVRNTPNVTWFLWAWNIPVPVSGEELERLKWKIEEVKNNFDTKLKNWDEVYVVGWTFDGNEGIITEVSEKKWTVKLNINLLWRDTPIELDFAQVKVKV